MNLSRSPYIIEIDEPLQTGSKIELFLWNTGSVPASPQYTLDKLIPASNSTATYYNISPYVREYFDLTKWSDIITFGKYKGKTVEDVASMDASYLVWLMRETNRTNFGEKMALAIYEDSQEEDLYDDIYLFDPNWD